MPRPGVDVFIMDEPQQAQAVLDPSQAFMAGTVQRGRLGISRSFSDFKKKHGGRDAYSQHMYDAARAFFEESGGATLYVSPVYGATSVEASGELDTFLTVTARGGGVWGNEVKVETVAPTSMTEVAMGGVIYEVEYPVGTVVERSPAMTTLDQAIDWSERKSNYVVFSLWDDPLATDVPTVGKTITLADGADDDTWDDADVEAALDKFNYALGPGQVSVPGHDSAVIAGFVAAHTVKNYRVGISDLIDSSDPMDLGSQLGGVYDFEGSRNLLSVGPWVSYPHETPPANILVPPSGVISGIIARVDKRGDPSLSAAGADGYSSRAVGLSQDYADDDREELNALGAALFKDVYGQMRMYGYRTSAGPNETNWLFFQESRVIMMIAHESNAVLEEYVLKTMDGKRQLLARVNVALSGVLARYWKAGALFGNTSSDAFFIDTDSPNTLETMAAGELYANVGVKTSKLAEWVVLNLVKYRTERPLPAAA